LRAGTAGQGHEAAPHRHRHAGLVGVQDLVEYLADIRSDLLVGA
jgi:hypothetical protein